VGKCQNTHTQNQLSEAGKEPALLQTKWHFIYVSHGNW